MVPWTEFQTIIFERGISVYQAQDHQWTYRSSASPVNVGSPDDVSTNVGVRPVVAVLPWKLVPPVGLILPSTKGRFLDIYRSELAPAMSPSLFYMMGAALYHCKRLAWWYADECYRLSQTPANLQEGHERIVLGGAEEPYFEFEALVTVIVRCFDTLRYSLWHRWGDKGSCPNSYERAVNAIVNCPDEIMHWLVHGLENIYRKAKNYRHCIQHYVDLGSTSWAMAELRAEGIWSTIVRIPDNPEVRSAKRFAFDQDIDSLTLGWQLCTETFGTIDTTLGSGNLSLQAHG
jgi:hypothetical protein